MCKQECREFDDGHDLGLGCLIEKVVYKVRVDLRQ